MVCKKRRNPGRSGAGEQTVEGEETFAGWTSFHAAWRFPEEPQIRATRKHNQNQNPNACWCIDTGANIAVTDPSDTSVIVELTDEWTNLGTSAGSVSARVAVLNTPVGHLKGLVSNGSPRILPGMEISRHGLLFFEFGRAYIRNRNGNLIQCRVVDDIPYLPAHVVLHTDENRRETRSNNELLEEVHGQSSATATSAAVEEPVCRKTVSEAKPVESEVSKVNESSQTNAAANTAGEPAVESSQPEKMAKEEPKTRVRKPRETIPEESAKEMIDAWRRHLLTHHPKRSDCEVCKVGKLPFTGHYRQNERDKCTEIGGKLYTDLVTSWPCARGQGERSLIGIQDEASGLVFVEPLRGKISKAVLEALLRALKQLNAFREYSGGELPQFPIVKSDWGGEYTALEVRDGLLPLGVVFEHGVPSRHVASAERLMKHISQGVRSLLMAAGLPAPFWSYAARTFAHNTRCENAIWVAYSKANGKPFQPRVFGQLVFVKLPEVTQPKTDAPGTPCAFLAYETNKTTHGMYVAYLRKNQIAVTLVDGRDLAGVYWPQLKPDGTPPMAFKRVIKNLKILTVPGEDTERSAHDNKTSEPEIETQLVELEDDEINFAECMSTDSSGLKPQLIKRKRMPESMCPACRGRKRKHTYGPTCIHEGKLPRDKVAMSTLVADDPLLCVQLATTQPEGKPSGAHESVKVTPDKLEAVMLDTDKTNDNVPEGVGTGEGRTDIVTVSHDDQSTHEVEKTNESVLVGDGTNEGAIGTVTVSRNKLPTQMTAQAFAEASLVELQEANLTE